MRIYNQGGFRRLADLMAYGNFPVFAPPGEGTEGGDDDSDNQLSGDDVFDFGSMSLDDSDNGDEDGLDTGDGITGDRDSVLSEFWKDPNAGDDDDDSDGDPDPQEVQKALATEMEASLSGMTIPEDLIPEDFNPSDPKQFRKLLTDVQAHTARNTLAIMFKPVQASLGHMARQLRKEMQATSEGAVSSSNVERMLLQAIPQAKDENIRPVIDHLMSQAKKRFPKDPKKQVLATKKAAALIGIKGSSTTNTGGRSGNRPSGEKGVLDMYAPLPKPDTSRREPENRSSTLQNRMRSGQ